MSLRPLYRTQNLTPRYQKSAPAEFLRLFGTDPENQGHMVTGLGAATQNKLVRLTERTEHEFSDLLTDFHLSGSTDVYMSPNRVREWRCTGQLARIQAFYIEIDTDDHGASADPESIRKQVMDGIYKAKLPLPSAYVESGSGGLHLYWFTDAEPSKANRDCWYKTAKKMSEKLSDQRPVDAGWIVDFAASVDIVRLLRLPGTVHWKHQKRVQAHINHDRTSYSFAELCGWQGIVVNKPKKPIQMSLPEVPRKKNPKTSTRHTFGDYHAKIFWHLTKHIRSEGIQQGQRDMACHLLLSSSLQLKRGDRERAMTELLELNEKYIGMTEVELTRDMKATLQRQYTYGKEKLNFQLRRVGLPELPSSSAPKLTEEEVAERRSQGAFIAANKKRNATLDLIVDALITKARCTQQDAAELTGRSLSTVKRNWKEAQRLADEYVASNQLQDFHMDEKKQGVISSPFYISILCSAFDSEPEATEEDLDFYSLPPDLLKTNTS